MNELGWVKLYRELKTKSIWQLSTPQQKVVLITILLLANHEENKWEWKGEQFACKPGQLITSLNSLVDECGKGVTVQNVRTALDRFEKLGFLTNQSTKTGRLITVVNWEKYQGEGVISNKVFNKDLTKSQQRPNKELTPNKNDKEYKNDKNNYISAFFEEIWKLYPNKKGKGQVSATQKKRLYEIGIEELTRAIDRYKAELEKDRDWRKPQNGSTFFNSGYVDYLDANYLDKPQEEKGENVKSESDWTRFYREMAEREEKGELSGAYLDGPFK